MCLNSPRTGCFSIKNVNFEKTVFARLHYPETLIENTIRHFIEMRVEDLITRKQVSDEHDAHIRIVLPFKDQKLLNAVRHQLGDCCRCPASLQKTEDQRTIQAGRSQTSNC